MNEATKKLVELCLELADDPCRQRAESLTDYIKSNEQLLKDGLKNVDSPGLLDVISDWVRGLTDDAIGHSGIYMLREIAERLPSKEWER